MSSTSFSRQVGPNRPAGLRSAHFAASALVLGALAMLPTTASAQDDEDITVESGSAADPDVRNDVRNGALFLEGLQERLAATEQRAAVGRVLFSVQSATELQGYQNRDLRPLNEATDQDVILSDDRTNFGHTDIVALMTYRVVPQLELDTQLKYDVIWRDDSLGRRADSGGTLSMFQLNFVYDAIQTDTFQASIRAGRQPFEIGGVPRDYVLQGTLDAVTVELNHAQAGRLRVLAVDLFGGNSLPVVGYQFYRDGSETVFGLRGETNTFRHGAIYEIDGSHTDFPLTVKAYYFFTSVGGGPVEETGADLTFGGAFGNFRDRDYTHLYGGRVSYSHPVLDEGTFNVYAEYSGSAGIDRKPDFFYDVDLGGAFFGGGLQLNLVNSSPVDPYFGAEFYRADGSTYASDGVEFERGYVGGRGARIGGLAIGRQAAWRPSAVMDAFGIDYTPHDISRSAGTQFLHAALGATFFDRLQLMVDWWSYTDTGETLVTDFENVAEPGFGLSREEISAQQRLGRFLGHEFNVELRGTFANHLALYSTFGVFLPGSYYDIEVSQVAGRRETSLGGGATFWAARLGGEVRF
jgi:hypothetical protein